MIIAPELVLVVPFCSKFAPLLKVTKLPDPTVKAPSSVTLSPAFITTVALLVTVNLQAVKFVGGLVPGEVKVPDIIAALDIVGSPLLHAVPFQVVVSLVIVITAEPLIDAEHPDAVVTDTKE